jgi:diguanylate cyclase (GGDEF)-like protein
MLMNPIATGMIVIGVGLLLSALFTVRQLIHQIPSGPVCRRWKFMAALVLFFIAGYVSYLAAFWNRHTEWSMLIVPGIFFLGASFVLLVAKLSLQTAADVRRVVLLEQESITDALTGIHNRRYMDRRLIEECARAKRYDLPLFVLLLDIDHFKAVNDSYGHPTDAQVLIYLGKLLLQGVRESDVVARYGGEELLIIAPHTTATAAQCLAERLRKQVESHTLMVSVGSGQRTEIRITVSIGVAGMRRGKCDSAQIVESADRALYQAKHEGRNRVVLLSDCESKARSAS